MARECLTKNEPAFNGGLYSRCCLFSEMLTETEVELERIFLRNGRDVQSNWSLRDASEKFPGRFGAKLRTSGTLGRVDMEYGGSIKTTKNATSSRSNSRKIS